MIRALVVGLAALTAACGPLVEGDRADVVAGHVVEVVANGDRGALGGGAPTSFQRLRVQLDESLYRGEVVELEWDGRRALAPNGFLRVGDRVLLQLTRDGSLRTYTILEVVRLPALVPLALLLVVALLVVARLTGLVALAGLAASIAVFLLAIMPALRRGDDPLVATLVGSVGVILVSVFVVHGVDRRSLAAACGALAGLGIVTGAGAFALAAARLTGLGAEDQILLQAGAGGRIDMARLALVAVMVGSLGAIVDVSVGQAHAARQLASADERMRGRRLYESALGAGRDHVASLVNTLALAYFGGALPLVLLLSLGDQPLAVALNGEAIVELLIAVVAASLGLVLSVPITTAIAALFFGRPELVAEDA